MSITPSFVNHSEPRVAVGATMLPVSPALVRKVEALRGLDVFAGASDEELQKLAESALLRRFERGRTVLRGGSVDECVVLIEGRVKTTMPRGISCGEFALGIVEAGEIISEGCWARQKSAEPGETLALEPSTVLFIPKRPLDLLLSRNSKVAIRFVSAIATKLRRVIELATQNACLDVGDRLYRKLVELSATRSRATPAGLLIEHGLYQAELAAGIGASREAVNRQLAAWRDRGLVEAGRCYVLVKDPPGLAMAASPAVRDPGFVEIEHKGAA
ncbi:MAG TPA: Crp/Fnr family transcriptional regulator [Candidatus Binatia bacterium]